MSVKYPNYVNLTSSSKEQPNKRNPSPPPRKKSLSPSQAPSKYISSKSTHYTSSSSPSESPTPAHVVPPPKLRFFILIKQESQELPPLQMSPNNPYVTTIDNWPPGLSNLSPPPRVSRPLLDFPNLPPGFEPLPLTQPLFVNINNNTPHLHNNAPPLENIRNPPPTLGNQDFPNPLNILDFVHPNDMPHLYNMFCQCPSKSKSSFLPQNFEKIEENHRNLQSSNNQKHTSSECNNIKLAIRNEKSEVICAMCKQCLITANHDECVLQYVNGMKYREKNQSANVSKSENQKKHKEDVKNSKKLGSKDSLASPKPSNPISCLRWLPTG
ncbi:hypothetical protein Tco_0513979 [Tanacetum coccineum]